MAVDYQYYEFRAFEYLIRLGQLWEGMEELPGVKKILQKLQEEQALIRSRKFRVAVVGEFRRGKTTFINALLGKEILSGGRSLPTTATLNRITYGSVPKAYLCWKDGGREEIGIEELSRYVTKLTEASAETASRIAEAVVEYLFDFLSESCGSHRYAGDERRYVHERCDAVPAGSYRSGHCDADGGHPVQRDGELVCGKAAGKR